MKARKLLICLSLTLLFIGLFIYSAFWYKFTSFYKDCERIQVGMTLQEVESIMRPYLNSKNYSVSREAILWGPGLYISSELSGNECDISIKAGVVDKIDVDFE